MRKRGLAIIGLALIVSVSLAALVACQPVAETSTQTPESMTLDSLQRVDDFPLYVMTYYGDYGFSEVLDNQGQASVSQAESEDWACTTFAALNADGDAILGRNFDWEEHPALLLFTDPPDGFASVSLVDMAYMGLGHYEPTGLMRERLLEAPFLPFDGMNEAGLAIGMMAIPHSEGGQDPEKVNLSSLEVIRLWLDYAANVDEAINLAQDINVSFEGGPPVHYLIADSSGESAVVEFLDNQVIVTQSDQPWQVATNFVVVEVPEGRRILSRERYRVAYETLERADGLATDDEALALLDAVSRSGPSSPTIWSVVYNMTTGDIQVAMGRQYHTVHGFSLEMLAQ